jgi:hypothetical protein
MFGIVPADARKSNSATSAVLVTNSVTSSKATSTVQNWAAPGYTFHSVVGYVPIDFLTAQVAPPLFGYFNAVPNQVNSSPPSASDPQILLLPIGARISGIYLTNNGVPITASAGGTTVTITAIDLAAPATNPQDLIAAAPIADVNTFGGLGKGISSSPLDIYTPINGGGYMMAPSYAALLTATYGLGFQISATNLTAGSLGVVISYLLPGNSFGTTNLL